MIANVIRKAQENHKWMELNGTYQMLRLFVLMVPVY
jgi:hypothetical protein